MVLGLNTCLGIDRLLQRQAGAAEAAGGANADMVGGAETK